MKKLKILYLDFNMPYLLMDFDCYVGGAAVEWYAWIMGFVANNQNIGVLTFKGASEQINRTLEFDIVESYSLGGGIPVFRWFYRRFPAVLDSVREYNPDYLVQACAGFETGLMAYIGKKLKIPFIYRVANDMDTDKRYKKTLSKHQQIAYEYGLKHSRAIICQNRYQYKRMKMDYPDKEITIIHNPYFYNGDPPEIIDQTDRKYIAWLGIFQYQKNLPALLDIVKKNNEVEFRVAGSALSSLDDDTKRALSGLRKCNNVKFVGYLRRTEITPFLSNAYALLNTSYYEGFSNTFLESFMAGTPVITTGKVDPDDIISSNGLGSIAGNYSEIPGLIISMIKRGDYNHIARLCRQYVLKEHDPKVLARRFIESLQTLS